MTTCRAMVVGYKFEGEKIRMQVAAFELTRQWKSSVQWQTGHESCSLELFSPLAPSIAALYLLAAL
jgi:hypothetical protein